jgi:hypothetical protein
MRDVRRLARRARIAASALALVAAGLVLGVEPIRAAEFTTDFRVEECTWSAWGARQNPFFVMRPGRQLVLEGEEDGTEIRAEVTMLRQIETIEFTTPRGAHVVVHARVMEEREFEDGEIVEVSRNWIARCVETSDVFYFGEEVDNYEDGELVDHHGEWRAGVDGAQPGILMPGRFLVGSRYYQEIAPGEAEDRAEHTRMGLGVAVPAGNFAGCVEVAETNPLSDSPEEVDIKRYCPWVGLVQDEELELVEVHVLP